MIKDAINRLIELATPLAVEVNTRQYTTSDLKPVYDPRAEPLLVGTLGGIKTFLDDGEYKGIGRAGLTLLVQPSAVQLVGLPCGPWARRTVYVYAEMPFKCGYPFGTWLDVETFIIHMHAGFVADEQAKNLIELASSMTLEQAITRADDGVSQSVLTSAGVHLKSKATVPNPVTLRAHRTFPEVEQPEAPYVLRVRGDAGKATLALFDVAGSGRWKLEASRAIAAWLTREVPGVAVMA